ncbi:ABC transporter ATP-binding protein [Brachybacterium vulturis]|uniref:ABC transporter ATP-binding protein n=1 Tax=Brachybacterium vulturis TaxID=2017484 RepID=UPI0037351F5B
MTTAPVISAQGLRKHFGRTRALDGLDLEVAPGEVHGFLGPNGAGKSTTMRVLLGLLHADGGTVRLLGGDPWRDAVTLHRRLAYVPGDVELWPTLTGGEAIDLLARLRGRLDRRKRDELCERFDLDPSKKARTYSKGNRQKVALISALASEVELLLLDEPTAGLDPLMEVVFQQAIREVKDAGRTVLLSSHILAQVEALADRLSIVRQGQIVETGSLSQLRHMTRTTFVAELEQSAAALERLDGIHDLSTKDGTVSFQVDGDRVDGVVRALAPLGVRSLVAHPPTLEQLLMRHYGDDADARGGTTDGGSVEDTAVHSAKTAPHREVAR